MVVKFENRKVFKLSVDVNDVTDMFQDMNKALKAAVVNTLNKVGRKANKEISNNIKKEYNINTKSLRIGKTVRLRRADGRKPVPVFIISILKKGRGLALYSPRKRKDGVSVKIKRSRKTVKNAYLVKSKKRGGKIFVGRKAKGGGKVERFSSRGKRYLASRSEWLYGPSIASLYRRRKAFKLLNKVLDENFKKELDVQFNNQFEKRRR